jgi:hypothetical protein
MIDKSKINFFTASEWGRGLDPVNARYRPLDGLGTCHREGG